MLIVSTIRLMLDLSVSCVPRPCLYMLGSSSQPKCFACVPRPCLYMLGSSSQPKCFACVPRPCLYMLGSSTPVVFKRKNLSHPIITWCFKTTNFRNGAQLGRTLSWNYSEGSSYLSCRHSKQIRCKNMINITCNQIVTWYGQYHFDPFLSPSSGRHDHHRHRHDTMISIIMISIIVSSWSCLANYYFYYYG